ncbi:hypothetical protein SFRURICE_010486 [Spodoptera frugiperda]|nr:hypothetical protein SFRURICE_010486 [Spodoptera frugiperda]
MTLNKRGVLLPSLSATAWELLFIVFRLAACQQPESNTSSGNLQRVLQRHQAALTGYGGGPSVYDPPPPYSGPAPSFNAPPPPYYGPQLPYYEPPPPYSETEPVPRLQPAPVQYEASRPCQLGTRLREDIFYTRTSAKNMKKELASSMQRVLEHMPSHHTSVELHDGTGCEDYDYEYQEPVSFNIDNILRGEISSQYDPPPPYPGPGPSNDAPPPPYWTLCMRPKMPYYEPPPPYIETTPAPRPQPVPVQYEASRPCKLGRNLRKDLFYINVMVPISMPANFSVRPQS